MHFKTVTRKNHIDVGALVGLDSLESGMCFLYRLQTEPEFIVELETLKRSIDFKRAVEAAAALRGI